MNPTVVSLVFAFFVVIVLAGLTLTIVSNVYNMVQDVEFYSTAIRRANERLKLVPVCAEGAGREGVIGIRNLSPFKVILERIIVSTYSSENTIDRNVELKPGELYLKKVGMCGDTLVVVTSVKNIFTAKFVTIQRSYSGWRRELDSIKPLVFRFTEPAILKDFSVSSYGFVFAGILADYYTDEGVRKVEVPFKALFSYKKLYLEGPFSISFSDTMYGGITIQGNFSVDFYGDVDENLVTEKIGLYDIRVTGVPRGWRGTIKFYWGVVFKIRAPNIVTIKVEKLSSEGKVCVPIANCQTAECIIYAIERYNNMPLTFEAISGANVMYVVAKTYTLEFSNPDGTNPDFEVGDLELNYPVELRGYIIPEVNIEELVRSLVFSY